MTRRRVAAGAGAALALGLVLAACAQDNTPSNYDTLTKQNFLQACTNHYYDNTNDTLAQTGNTIASNATPADQGQCECMYQVFVDQMPFDSKAAATIPNYNGLNFVDFNKKLNSSNPQDEWNKLPQDMQDKIKACSSGTTASTVTGGSTTTVAGGSTTTVAGGTTATTG